MTKDTIKLSLQCVNVNDSYMEKLITKYVDAIYFFSSFILCVLCIALLFWNKGFLRCPAHSLRNWIPQGLLFRLLYVVICHITDALKHGSDRTMFAILEKLLFKKKATNFR